MDELRNESKTMGTHDDEAGSSRSKRSRQHETMEDVLLPQVHYEFLLWKDVTEMQSLEIDDMLRIRLREAGSDEEIFTSFVLMMNCNQKIIRFRLGGRAHSLTLLELARRLGLYQAVELEEEGLMFYLRRFALGDENFICSRYDKVYKNDMWLLSMFDARHQNGYTNVAWVIARWMKRKGAGTQKESQICCGQFISKIARKCRVLIEDVDLYDMMGRMEIRQEVTANHLSLFLEKSANMLPVVSQICIFAPQLHESAGGLPKTKLVSHSCSLARSTSAMEVSIPIAFVLPDREHECNESFKLGRSPALS
ncbi:hypothetical protein Tco_0520668 [Tanacetum coccineum]